MGYPRHTKYFMLFAVLNVGVDLFLFLEGEVVLAMRDRFVVGGIDSVG